MSVLPALPTRAQVYSSTRHHYHAPPIAMRTFFPGSSSEDLSGAKEHLDDDAVLRVDSIDACELRDDSDAALSDFTTRFTIGSGPWRRCFLPGGSIAGLQSSGKRISAMNPKNTLARFGNNVGTGLAAARPRNLFARHKLQDAIDSNCRPKTALVARVPCWRATRRIFYRTPHAPRATNSEARLPLPRRVGVECAVRGAR